jgi:hypothetical protein
VLRSLFLIGVLAAAVSFPPAVAAAEPTYSLSVEPSGELHPGDTVTVTPTVTGVADDVLVRCLMYIQSDYAPGTWDFVRMEVGSSTCTPWTFTVPNSPAGGFRISGHMSVGLRDGLPEYDVYAHPTRTTMADAPTTVPFTSNYPVQSWDPGTMLSTAEPRYAELITMRPPALADACDMRVAGGYDSTTTRQSSSCAPWTFSFREPTAEVAFADMYTGVAQISGWSGTSPYRVDVQYWDAAGNLQDLRGSMFGETWNLQLPDFAPSGSVGAYSSDLPAIFVEAGPAHLSNDPTEWPVEVFVRGTSTGLCRYVSGVNAPTPRTTPVVPGGCAEGAYMEPGYRQASTDPVASVSVELVDDDGTLLSQAYTKVAFVRPMDDVVVNNPASAETSTTVQVDAGVSVGAPASYEVTAIPVMTSGSPTQAATDSGRILLGSGTLSPTVAATGDQVSVSHAFPTPGRYRITAIFTDVTGATSTGSSLITIGTPSATPCASAPFTDVGTAHPFCPQIEWLKQSGLTTGYADGSFHPTDGVTRMAMAAFLARLSGPTLSPCTQAPYSDVPTTQPFCKEITWLKTAGISQGFADGTFRPTATLTRMAMASFLSRLFGADQVACTAAPFADVPISHPFCPAISWMKSSGITTGYADNTFRPSATVTRMAMAAFLARAAVLP